MQDKVEFSFKFYLKNKNQGKLEPVEVKGSYFTNNKSLFVEGVYQYVDLGHSKVKQRRKEYNIVMRMREECEKIFGIQKSEKLISKNKYKEY